MSDVEVILGADVELLLADWVQAGRDTEALKVRQNDLHRQIAEAMDGNRQEFAEIDAAQAVYRAETEWNREELQALKEFVSPAEWDALLTNPKPPERKPNLTKIKQLAKQGEPFKSIVERAQYVGRPRLKITKRSGKTVVLR